jgi:hypothetical protein
VGDVTIKKKRPYLVCVAVWRLDQLGSHFVKLIDYLKVSLWKVVHFIRGARYLEGCTEVGMHCRRQTVSKLPAPIYQFIHPFIHLFKIYRIAWTQTELLALIMEAIYFSETLMHKKTLHCITARKIVDYLTDVKNMWWIDHSSDSYIVSYAHTRVMYLFKHKCYNPFPIIFTALTPTLSIWSSIKDIPVSQFSFASISIQYLCRVIHLLSWRTR